MWWQRWDSNPRLRRDWCLKPGVSYSQLPPNPAYRGNGYRGHVNGGQRSFRGRGNTRGNPRGTYRGYQHEQAMIGDGNDETGYQQEAHDVHPGDLNIRPLES